MIRAILIASWSAWIAVWAVAALGGKQVARCEGMISRALHVLPLGAAAYLLARQPVPAWLRTPILPGATWFGPIGAALTVSGIALTFWARVVLGGNWSGMVTVKQDHELIRRGPYAVVRHPIYTGLLIAVAGTAIDANTWSGLLALVLALLGLLRKIALEERFMGETFGAEWRCYAARTARLAPYLW